MSGSPAASFSFRWFPALFALFALLCVPLMLVEHEGPYTADETAYYLPAIRQIRTHWPALDPSRDSLSATAPGYHYFLATVSLLTGTGRWPLRVVNFAVSAAVLIVLWRVWPVGTDPRLALAALLPLAASNFFVKSASFVVTDNAALLTVTAALVALSFSSRPAAGIHAGIFSAAAVFIRQSNTWLAGPLAVYLCQARARTWHWVAFAFPFGVLFWLASAWGGLVPPAWQPVHYGAAGLVPAAGAYALAVLAPLGAAYYAAALASDWRDDFRSPLVAVGLVAGLGLALSGPTTPDYETGRWGGYFWSLAGRLPAWGDRSCVFLALTPLGGAMLVVLTRRLWRETGRAALPWLAAFAAWSVASLANRQVFHRYFEPTILVLLICWLALLARARMAQGRATSDLRPLAALGLVQVSITMITAHGRTFGFF